jgi:hypothetical protein
MQPEKLSATEVRALEILRDCRAMLITQVPETTVKASQNVLGEVEPGLPVYVKLQKRGLCVITEEEPCGLPDMEDFVFTPMIESTEEGLTVLSQYLKLARAG